jgi:Ca2+-binding RTX toxin-like protein
MGADVSGRSAHESFEIKFKDSNILNAIINHDIIVQLYKNMLANSDP